MNRLSHSAPAFSGSLARRWPWLPLIALLLVPGLPGFAEPAAREIAWNDLLPREKSDFDDPFERLSEEQLVDLGLVARIRDLMANRKISLDGPDAAEEKAIVERLTADGIDVDWLLAQRERVAEQRRRQAEQVDGRVDGQAVRIPGYVLPLKRDEATRVTEFLLVPWVGACIHTPPPPPNQMIHVSVPDGIEDRGRFAPIWLEGRIRLRSRSYDLFLVDGTRTINVAYSLAPDAITDYSSRESDVLAKIDVPAFDPEHSWWRNLQNRGAILFTGAMAGIRDGATSGSFWMALLIAFAYGVIHTLGPGHGKAVVISYFAGHGGNVRRGLLMGVRISICHVFSAVVVVCLTDFAVRQATGAAPSDYRLVKLISYAAIAAIGGFMLIGAIRNAAARHPHDHPIEESGHHHRHHSDGCGACQAATATEKKGPAGWLALAIGSVPCTGALLVLLFGMANNLLLPAILMVAAISAGMAVAMSGVGILAIFGRNFADRKLAGDAKKRLRFIRGVRIVGAAAVLLIGLGLFGLVLATKPFIPIDPTAGTVSLPSES